MKKAVFLMLLICGCKQVTITPAPKTVPVSGKVTLASGTPLTGGRIIFKPKQASVQEAVGEINKDGTFTLSSYAKDDGAVPGEYTVVIEKLSYKTGNAVPVYVNFPAKYADSKTSDLVVTVQENGIYNILLK